MHFQIIEARFPVIKNNHIIVLECGACVIDKYFAEYWSIEN